MVNAEAVRMAIDGAVSYLAETDSMEMNEPSGYAPGTAALCISSSYRRVE